MSKHILSVSYNESLLRTGELLLRREGYRVTSALGFTEATKQCHKGNFDLLILGHSIPENDKRELVRIFRSQSDSPVLALRTYGEVAPDDADEHAFPQDIEELLKSIAMLLRRRPKAKSRKR